MSTNQSVSCGHPPFCLQLSFVHHTWSHLGQGAGAGMGEARCCHCPLGDSSGHPGPQMACCIWGARHARFRCQNNTGFLRSGVIASLLALPCVLTCGHPRLLCYTKRITKSQCFINFWDPLLPER